MKPYHLKITFESKKSKVSLTEVQERLDIENMLNRAAAGILDLTTYHQPMDFEFKSDDPHSVDLDTSAFGDRIFGCSREQAEAEYQRNIDIVANDIKEKKTNSDPAAGAPGPTPSEE